LQHVVLLLLCWCGVGYSVAVLLQVVCLVHAKWHATDVVSNIPPQDGE